MAEKGYKVSEAIKVLYQAPGAATGKTVTMEIYDESGAKDGVNFPDVTMDEIGSSGRYEGDFTPDAQGDWQVHIALADGSGKVVKHFEVGAYNIHAVGGIVGAISTAVDTVSAAVDTVSQSVDAVDSALIVVDTELAALDSAVVVVDTELAAVDSAIVVVDNELAALDSQGEIVESKVGTVSQAVDDLGSPAMLG